MSTSSRRRARIAFDTWVLGPHAAHHGVQVYARNLLYHFAKLASEYWVEIDAYVSRPNNGVAPSSELRGYSQRPTALLRNSRVWRYGGAWYRTAADRMSLIFSPHCTTLYAGYPVPVVTTIHDLIPEILPWQTPEIKRVRFFLRSAVKNSWAIITDSQNSKADLMRIHDLPGSRIHVIYLGCNHEVFNDSAPNLDRLKDMRGRIGLDRPYLLHYGAIKANKNLKRLILAYRLLRERNPELELDLVLAGVFDSARNEVVEAAQPKAGASGRVVLAGPIDAADLPLLIKGASLAVFPSLYEGFCLPMIECMACGVPTIAARSSCLPEISGGVLRYFDPESVEDMASCIKGVLEDSELRRDLAQKGVARAADFEWRRCARETLSLLSTLAYESKGKES